MADERETVDFADLTVGKRYRVEMNDCCVSGWFEATLTELVYVEDHYLDVIRFEGAEVGPIWGGIYIYEVPEASDVR